jgi:hypothetical protein
MRSPVRYNLETSTQGERQTMEGRKTESLRLSSIQRSAAALPSCRVWLDPCVERPKGIRISVKEHAAVDPVEFENPNFKALKFNDVCE